MCPAHPTYAGHEGAPSCSQDGAFLLGSPDGAQAVVTVIVFEQLDA